MQLRHLLTLLCIATLSALPLSAQVFVGSDNFNDNTLTIQSTGAVNGVAGSTLNQAAGLWRAENNDVGGDFSETGQRLEYTNSSTSGTLYSSLVWTSPSFSVNGASSAPNLGIGGSGLSNGAPYTSSWSAQVELSNLTTPAAGYTLAGMELYTLTTSNGSNTYFGAYLSNDASNGNRLMVEWGLWNGSTDFTRTPSFFNIGDNQDVTVRATFDGSTKVLSYDYSTNGTTFTSTGVSYDLDGAQAGLTAPNLNGIGLSLVGFSNGATGAITSGQMYYDNLSVSAIPEPSTYAAFAGLGALGLALWRRRQAKKSA